MKRIIVVATILGLSAFAAFAQRGGGRAMGRAGAAVPPAGAQNAQAKAPHQGMGMPAGAQHQAGVKLTPAMTARLQPLLPPGVPIETAAEGFRNNGQFVAALHVSQNLGIPFDQLKAKMTGPEAVSLGKAIEGLNPKLPEEQVTEAVKTAERQARDDERAKQPKQKGTQPSPDQTVSK